MRSYVIISQMGCGFFMVPHLARSLDTRKVYFHTAKSSQKELGKNMNKFPGWEKLEVISEQLDPLKKELKEDLIFIFDDNGQGDLADHLRSLGYPVVGGGAIADAFENDRWGTIQYMKKLMDVPETEYFENFESGIEFLKGKEKNERWVFKPQDADVPKDKTYVGKDISDLITAIEGYRDIWEWKDGFVLQKFVKGIEATFNGYFDGERFMPGTFGLYFENKPFMSGDIGPATGGEIAVQIWRKNEGPLFEILDKMSTILKKNNYHGQMDINCIFSEENHKPYFLELTPRFGYPGAAMEITMIEEQDKSYATFIKAIALGGSNTEWFPTDKITTEIALSVPPYPSDKDAESVYGVPLSWDKEWDRYMFPVNVNYNLKKKTLQLMGYSGQCLNVTCVDSTLDGAVAMTYDTYIPSVKLQDKQYRNDLGKSAKERIKTLKEWGLIT